MEYPDDVATHWDWIQFDLDGVRAAVRSAASRVAELVRATTDGSRPAHRLDWTISETAAHLVVVMRAYTHYAEGHTDPVLELDRLAETNRARIDELPERDVRVLADALESSVEALLLTTEGLEAEAVVPWHSRTELPLGGVLGAAVAELLLHGRDIALGQRARWPMEEADAVHAVRAGMTFAPLVVDADLARTRPVTYRVRCRGVPDAIYRFADGALTITPDRGEPVHCRVRLDPVTFVLVAFGRRSPLVAALQGRALSVGRRPLAALRLPSYFAAS